MHCYGLILHGVVGVWMVGWGGGLGGWGGGYVSLLQFVLRFIKVSSDVSGAIWQKFSGIRSVLAISFICWV